MLNSPTSVAYCTLFFFWVQLDHAGLLPRGPHEGLIYETNVESEEDLLAQIMAVADVGLPGIGDTVRCV